MTAAGVVGWIAKGFLVLVLLVQVLRMLQGSTLGYKLCSIAYKTVPKKTICNFGHVLGAVVLRGIGIGIGIFIVRTILVSASIPIDPAALFNPNLEEPLTLGKIISIIGVLEISYFVSSLLLNYTGVHREDKRPIHEIILKITAANT